MKRHFDGRFACKGNELRHTHSIRVTDHAWSQLRKLADIKGVSVSDIINEASSHPVQVEATPCNTYIWEALEVLERELGCNGFSFTRTKEQIAKAVNLLKKVID